MTEPTRKFKKTDTQSLARCLNDDSLDIGQVKEMRNASYKAGFAMAANILRGHLREVERNPQVININKLISWTEECQYWRRNNSMDAMPEL